MFIAFDTGIPDMTSLLEVEGMGLCTFESHYEDGRIRLYMGNGRRFIVGGKSRWRYVRKAK